MKDMLYRGALGDGLSVAAFGQGPSPRRVLVSVHREGFGVDLLFTPETALALAEAIYSGLGAINDADAEAVTP